MKSIFNRIKIMWNIFRGRKKYTIHILSDDIVRQSNVLAKSITEAKSKAEAAFKKEYPIIKGYVILDEEEAKDWSIHPKANGRFLPIAEDKYNEQVRLNTHTIHSKLTECNYTMYRIMLTLDAIQTKMENTQKARNKRGDELALKDNTEQQPTMHDEVKKMGRKPQPKASEKQKSYLMSQKKALGISSKQMAEMTGYSLSAIQKFFNKDYNESMSIEAYKVLFRAIKDVKKKRQEETPAP